MKITTHGDYLVQLTRFVAFNCQLVREDDGFTLIDTLFGGSARGILAAAQQLGAPIQRIALTHAHSDHVGSLDALHAVLPDVEVAISARDARFLAGERSLDPDEPKDKLRGGYVTVKTRPTRLLKPGDSVGSLEVVASPGHTPGHISFFDHRDGTLIAGDAYSTQGGIAVASIIRWAFPLPGFAAWHRATCIRSAEALLALHPNRLAVGHGKVIEQPVADMQRAIAEAKRKSSRASGEESFASKRTH
ncbi:MAG TPA: MBL fold metallo-hydrolase [Aggregatilineales bacterium]|nr:MBL fold metallo-hydrolase [Aggregatilineales bacterium]